MILTALKHLDIREVTVIYVALIIYDAHLSMYIAFCDMEFLLLSMVSTKKTVLSGSNNSDHVGLQASSSGILVKKGEIVTEVTIYFILAGCIL